MHEGGVLGRGHVELVHAPDLIAEEVPADGWPVGATVAVLSRDRQTGELTGILRLPRGYRRGAGHYATATETFVLSGTVRVGEDVRGYGFYESAGPGVAVGPWAVAEGCELCSAPAGGRTSRAARAKRGSSSRSTPSRCRG